MCGICGVASVEPTYPPVPAERLLAMTDVMRHRGPDEAGHFYSRGIALGMRRLSVIDLAGSHQPSTNEVGTAKLVFNGEIFNFHALRRELSARGHRFASAGDTETIVHLYEERGSAFVDRLRGMFAVALWDEEQHKLVLARDRLGVKPLYYSLTDEGLAFASEIKCLLAGGLLTPRLDLDAAALFLSLGYVPAPRTLFQDVNKLPPGTVLEWERGRLNGPTPYWSPADPPRFLSASWEEDQEHLLKLLRDAVQMRMISDVPLGLMLSGGLDSSLIAALMAEASSKPVETFSIGFVEDNNANELDWARLTANRIGANHHELLTSAREHDTLLDEALWHLEEPIADLSFIGFLLLSRLARQHVTVALCGQAADELLGGYRKHLAAWAADLTGGLPPRMLRLASLAARRGRYPSAANRLVYAITAQEDLERQFAMSAIAPASLLEELAGPELHGRDPLSLLAGSFAGETASPTTYSRLGRTLMLDLLLALPDLMFLYFDKLSMAASLEVRVPFADHELVNFCMALPDDRRVRLGRGKELLRRVSKDLVDDTVIARPKRGFFRGGASAWLAARDQMVRETLLDHRCRTRGILNPEWIAGMLAASDRGGRAGEPLLAAFMLEQWHRLFIDGEWRGVSVTDPQ